LIAENLGHEPGGNIAGEQPVAVLAEYRPVPGRLVDAETDEPAEEEVVLQPLDDLALRADAMEGL
jgi:hypothetical protein